MRPDVRLLARRSRSSPSGPGEDTGCVPSPSAFAILTGASVGAVLITADDAEAPTDPNAESAPVPVAELDELCAVLVDGYPAMTATSSTGEKRLVVADVDRRLDAAVSALGSLAANADRSLDEVNALLDNAVGTVGSLPSALDSAQEPQVDFPASRLDAQLLAATDELERMGAASCASPPRLLPG